MLQIKKLSKSFEGHLVLNSLNLEVKSGETTVIIGRSGCGKSVLLKHIVGLMKPDHGEILIDGQDIARVNRQELNKMRIHTGMLFQSSALFDSLTVGENVGFALREHTRLRESQIRDRVKECLEWVGLQGIEELKPSELSGGMKKRVALARAICTRPDLLLYDEPTTGLDPIMADAINSLIKTLHDRLKVTSIAVTHDMVSAYKIADRIAMLYHGEIIESGTPDEIKATKNPIVRQFILGEAVGPITR